MAFSHVITLIRKELKSYFNSPMAYIFIVVFLTLNAWLFFRMFFFSHVASMRSFFAFLPWLFLFFIPASTMRMWSEEKRNGTIEVLMTLPVKDWEVVLGKFLSSFIFLAITILLTFPIPIMVGALGEPDWGVIFAGYIGALFLGAAFLAIGLWVSSFTKNQIISFIVGVLITFILFVIGESIVLFSAPTSLVPVLRYLGLGTHFQGIARGVLDTRDILYYVFIIFVFLYLNMKSIENRKWR